MGELTTEQALGFIAGEEPTPQVSKEAAERTIQRQQNAPRGYRITGQKIMRRLVSEWEPYND